MAVITRKWLKNHLTYSWWKYLVLVVACVMGVDMLFAMTAYRVPEDKKVEVYILNDYIQAQALEETLWPPFAEAYPDQEQLTVLNINLAGGDIYAAMQFSAYAAAQQGDVCLMPVSEVEKLAADGAQYAFLELTPYVESGLIDTEGIDLTPGRMSTSDGTEGLYAIPADTLYGLLAYGNDPADSMLCILDYSGNDEHAAAVLGMIIDLGRAEKPEGYDEMRGAQEQTNIF